MITIDDEVMAMVDAYLDEPCDWDIRGTPITRREAGWKVDVLSFAAGISMYKQMKGLDKNERGMGLSSLPNFQLPGEQGMRELFPETTSD